MNITAPEAIEASKQAILSDPAKFRAHMDTLENGLKAEIVEHIPQWFTDYTASVESSNDPDVKMRHIKQMLDFVGWGSSAKRVENPQDKLPVFHITIGRQNTVAITATTETTSASGTTTQEVTDVFDLDALTPTPQMLAALTINNDIQDMDTPNA